MPQVKKELRKSLIARRKSMDTAYKARLDGLIFDKLTKSDVFKNSSMVLLYVSTEIEVDTQKLIDYCFKTGKRVAAPVSLDTELLFREIKSREDLKIGRYDILEPVAQCPEITDFSESLCIVPALSVNTNGYRIGYGKGYYDRFLSRYNGISVCLCYKEFIGEIPVDEYDIKPDFIITD